MVASAWAGAVRRSRKLWSCWGFGVRGLSRIEGLGQGKGATRFRFRFRFRFQGFGLRVSSPGFETGDSARNVHINTNSPTPPPPAAPPSPLLGEKGDFTPPRPEADPGLSPRVSPPVSGCLPGAFLDGPASETVFSPEGGGRGAGEGDSGGMSAKGAGRDSPGSRPAESPGLTPALRVQGSGFRVQTSGFRVQGAGCRVQGSGCRVQCSGLKARGSQPAGLIPAPKARGGPLVGARVAVSGCLRLSPRGGPDEAGEAASVAATCPAAVESFPEAVE